MVTLMRTREYRFFFVNSNKFLIKTENTFECIHGYDNLLGSEFKTVSNKVKHIFEYFIQNYQIKDNFCLSYFLILFYMNLQVQLGR